MGKPTEIAVLTEEHKQVLRQIVARFAESGARAPALRSVKELRNETGLDLGTCLAGVKRFADEEAPWMRLDRSMIRSHTFG